MMNLSKYCYNDLQRSMSYWLRSADTCNLVFDTHLPGCYFEVYGFDNDNQWFRNYLRSGNIRRNGRITRGGYVDSSCDICLAVQFTPLCKI